MRLSDRVAIVTGAASGMGAATARLFAREGAKVIVADVLEAEGRELAAAIAAERGQARFQRLDVASAAAWEAAVAAALADYGRLDILINNAGISGSDPDRLSVATWEAQMRVNATGVFLGMRAVIPEMQKERRGAIVNISSISGIVGQDFVHMGYNAAKGAIRAMTKAAAVQFAKDGIRVNSVHPGAMMGTTMFPGTTDEVAYDAVRKRLPLRRVTDATDVADAVVWLLSDLSSQVTGREMVVDAGATLDSA